MDEAMKQYDRWREMLRDDPVIQEAAFEEMISEIANLRAWVIAFGAPWASNYGEGHYGSGTHLHPRHYDVLKRCGARTDDFVRMDE